MKRNYHIVYVDPFISATKISAYISSKTNFETVAVGHLFMSKITANSGLDSQIKAGKIPYYSVFEEVILEEIKKTEKGLIIPDYPRFLDSLSDLDKFIPKLRENDLLLSSILYIQNSDIQKTIDESARLRQKNILPGTIENAIKGQLMQSEIIKLVSSKYKVNYLKSNTLIEVPEETKLQIDQYLHVNQDNSQPQ